MTTARDIVTKAMQKAGIIRAGDAPTAIELQDGLSSLNGMLGSWSNNSTNIVARAWENFTLLGGVAEYTIGVGGDFNTARPTAIIDAFYRIDTLDYKLRLVNDEAYFNVDFKSLQSLPDVMNYDNGYPLGKIRIYPVPSGSYPIYLLTEKPLATYAADDIVDLPAGTERALIYNLALEIAPEYQQSVDPLVVKIAGDSLESITAQIERARGKDWLTDAGTDNNIYTGWFVR